MAIHLELLRQKLSLSEERRAVPAVSVRGSVLGLGATQPQVSDSPTTALLSPSPGTVKTAPDVDVLQHVTILGNEVHRLDDVIQGFLRFIRPEELVHETLDVTDLIDELINLVRPEAERTGVTIDHTHPSLPSIVRCDRAMLRQGLRNLTVNAFQAMPEGGRIGIAVSHPKGWIQIDIEDDGPGMPPEVLERAFELYYTTKAEGSGIGLSMVFRIMQLHGGSIDIESTVGGGHAGAVEAPTGASGACPERYLEGVVTTSQRGRAHLLVLFAVATGAAGCAPGARVGLGPVLRIPEAPPRVVTQLPVSPPEPAPAEAEPTTAENTDAAAAEDKRPASVRQAAPVEDPTEVATDAIQTQSPRELTSVPDQDTDRRTVLSTTALLNRLDRSDLDASARAQFDTARRFLDQAEAALAADSLVFALSLGQKAQALAQGL